MIEKSSKNRKFFLFVLTIVVAECLCCVVCFALRGLFVQHANRSFASVQPDLTQTASHIRFLNEFGWSVGSEPVEISQISVPSEFDAVFNEYNALQLAQGFDLTPYKGIVLDKYVYRILNYPGWESDDTVRADILVFRGEIVGGDICSVRLNGFLQGFMKE